MLISLSLLLFLFFNIFAHFVLLQVLNINWFQKQPNGNDEVCCCFVFIINEKYCLATHYNFAPFCILFCGKMIAFSLASMLCNRLKHWYWCKVLFIISLQLCTFLPSILWKKTMLASMICNRLKQWCHTTLLSFRKFLRDVWRNFARFYLKENFTFFPKILKLWVQIQNVF